MNAIRAISLLFILALCVSGCQSNNTPPLDISPLQSPNFGIYIFKENWHELELGYEGDHAQDTLNAADANDSLFVLGVDQIDRYDWNLQTITLTKKATSDLLEALANADNTDSLEISKLKDLKRNLGYGNALESALYIRGFVVKLDGQAKYGGIFLDAVSQMAIDFPVIRVTVVDDKAVFAILPTHIPFVMIDPVDGSGKLRSPDIVQEAQHDVQQLDFFPEWVEELSLSESSVQFRTLIRDETIRLLFENANKLKH
ncbi:MAG: hypothetical protein HYZ23_09610 [Chloroflexi bacterium]|nr:hypothetical protein [Chloroflexota bacterium]